MIVETHPFVASSEDAEVCSFSGCGLWFEDHAYGVGPEYPIVVDDGEPVDGEVEDAE